MKREITFAQAIHEALDICLANDPAVFLIGEGVPDPKGIFGTTAGLAQKYGPNRVMDMPVAENGLTGICVGAALRGMRPVLTHQRVDFAILSLDQLINNAAKWYFMFGGLKSVPLVVRVIVGRGWGQGAQHAQSLQSIFAHIPGLKVVLPATVSDAKGLMIAAIEDANPVICIEHRWLHGLKGEVPEGYYRVPLGQANVLQEGKDLTIVASSHMTIECRRAVSFLERMGLSVELIDVRTIKPLDEATILKSVKKTGRLLVADGDWLTAGFAGEIVSRVCENVFSSLKGAPRRVTWPDIPSPSTPALTKDYYPGYRQIVGEAAGMFGLNANTHSDVFKDVYAQSLYPADVPDLSFTGPF